MTTKDEKTPPRKWWQWLLVYPTLAISVLSAIPTYIEFVGASRLGVPFGSYRSAMKENQLWQENIECAAAPFSGLANQNNIEVDAVVCLSGNVLVRVKPPSKKTAYKWVPLDTVTVSSALDLLMRNASAADTHERWQIAQGNFTVICQQWLGNGLLRRRIHDRGGNRCFDEVVNTFSGQVIRWNPAPCNCN